MICPTCGDELLGDWCAFCERVIDTSTPLPRVEPAEVATALGAVPRGCAFQKCDDPACWICYGMQKAFTVVRCPYMSEIDGEQCRFVVNHPGPCKGARRRKKAENTQRGGTAKTKRRDPTFVARRRDGPHR